MGTVLAMLATTTRTMMAFLTLRTIVHWWPIRTKKTLRPMVMINGEIPVIIVRLFPILIKRMLMVME